jgi:PAS domain-containing protein
MMEFQRYPADVVFPAMMSDVRRFQIRRGDFGEVDHVEAKVKELVDHLKVPGGVRFERTSPSGHYIEVSYKPLDNGTIISIHRNITELKEREASLAAAKEAAEAARTDTEHTRQVMQTVLDNMAEGVQMLDKDFRVEFVNRRMLELQNWTMEIAGPGTSGYDSLRYMAKRGDFGADIDVERPSSASSASAIRAAHAMGGAPWPDTMSSITSIRLRRAASWRSPTTSPRSSSAKRRCGRRAISSS